VLYGWLLDNNSYRCESLTDLSYPVVLLQGGESRGDRFIESLRGNLYGVLNVSKISDRNRARSKNHVQEGSIFAFCSLLRAVAILRANLRGGTLPEARFWIASGLPTSRELGQLNVLREPTRISLPPSMAVAVKTELHCPCSVLSPRGGGHSILDGLRDAARRPSGIFDRPLKWGGR